MSQDSGLGWHCNILELDFRAMTLVYVKEDEEWSNYVLKRFEHKKLNLKIHKLNVTALGRGSNPPELEATIRESYVTMLLMTSHFLTYMEDNATWLPLLLRKRDRDVTSIVSALLHVSDDDLKEVSENHGYDYDTWELIEVDISGKNIKECVSQTLGLIDKNTQCRNDRMLSLKRKSGTGSTSSESLDSIESPVGTVRIEMVPSSINGAGERVALIFMEKIEGVVTVSIHGVKEEIVPIRLNPYCVTFMTPEIMGTAYHIHVYVDGVRQTHFRLAKYGASPASKFSSVEFMCQTLGVNSKEELDIKLADTFKTSICADRSAKMLYDKALESATTAKSTHQDSRHPTAVHWAATNGLKDLCSALQSSPGFEAACRIRNSHGYFPSDLAKKHGHQELSDSLRKFLSPEDGGVSMKDLYLEIAELADFPVSEPPPLPPRSKGAQPPPIVPRVTTNQRKSWAK